MMKRIGEMKYFSVVVNATLYKIDGDTKKARIRVIILLFIYVYSDVDSVI